MEKVMAYLTSYFRPDKVEEGYDLSIAGGEGGARLSHSHEKQFLYVLQSLSLWREVSTFWESGGWREAQVFWMAGRGWRVEVPALGSSLQNENLTLTLHPPPSKKTCQMAHDMFRLWCLSEDDLLAHDNRYLNPQP